MVVIDDAKCSFSPCQREPSYVAMLRDRYLIFSCAEHLPDIQGYGAVRGMHFVFVPLEEVCESCLQD